MDPPRQRVLDRVLHDLTHGSPARRAHAAAYYILAVDDGRHVASEAELRAISPFLVAVVEDPRFPRRPAGWLSALVAWSNLDVGLLTGRARDVDSLRRLRWATFFAAAAADLAPDHPLSALARAATLVAQGRPDDACALLSLASAGALRNHAAALAVRAFAELRGGRPDEARRALERAERLDPAVELVQQARRELDAATGRAPR